MNKLLILVLVPLGLFAALVVLWGSGAILMGVITLIGDSLRSMFVFGTRRLPQTLQKLLTDPWKVAAIPIAIGVAVLVIGTLIYGPQESKSDGFIRGRRLGNPGSGRPRYTPPTARQSNAPQTSTMPRKPFGRRA